MGYSLYEQLQNQSGLFSPISPFRDQHKLAQAIGPSVAAGYSQQMVGSYNNASNALAAQAQVMAQALRGKQGIEAERIRNQGSLDLDAQKNKNIGSIVSMILNSQKSKGGSGDLAADFNSVDRTARPGANVFEGSALDFTSNIDMDTAPSPAGTTPVWAEQPDAGPPAGFTKSDRAVGASPDQIETAKRQKARQNYIKNMLQGFMDNDELDYSSAYGF